MNESLINEFGGKPLLPIINQIYEDFPVDPKYSLLYNFGHLNEIESQNAPSSDPLNLTNTLSRLSIYGINPLFEFFVDADAKDPKNNVLYLTQSGLGLPSKEYYEEDEILLVYKEVMIELLNLALNNNSSNVTHHHSHHNFTGSDDLVDDILKYSAKRFLYKKWEEYAKKIIDFEIALAKISLSA